MKLIFIISALVVGLTIGSCGGSAVPPQPPRFEKTEAPDALPSAIASTPSAVSRNESFKYTCASGDKVRMVIPLRRRDYVDPMTGRNLVGIALYGCAKDGIAMAGKLNEVILDIFSATDNRCIVSLAPIKEVVDCIASFVADRTAGEYLLEKSIIVDGVTTLDKVRLEPITVAPQVH